MKERSLAKSLHTISVLVKLAPMFGSPRAVVVALGMEDLPDVHGLIAQADVLCRKRGVAVWREN